MKEAADAVSSDISVITNEGVSETFSILLPKVEAPEEFELMSRYLDANRLNAAALLGQLDNTDCASIPVSAITARLKERPEANYDMPEEPLVCGVSAGLSDIKLILAEGGRIRRILSYDWNPLIATEDAMISNPIYELIEMAADGRLLDAIALSVPGNEVFLRIKDLDKKFKPLCRDGAPVKLLDSGNMAAYSVYNELKYTKAGQELIKDGIIALELEGDIAFGHVRADGSIPSLPGALSKCIFRIDSEEEAGFPDQGAILKSAGMPVNNPKPCIDLLMNMAEGGEQNAETVFKNIGLYLGHAIREIDFFMRPGTDKYILLGSFAKSEYVFDLMSIGLQKTAPDAVVLQIDRGIANSPIMKALAEMGDIAIAEFAKTAGCVYYALEN